MADVEMIYEHSRACDVHAEATREHGPVVWCVNRAEHLGPGMYAAQPYPRDKGWGLPYVLVGLSLPALRALLPSGLKRQAPMSGDPEISLEWWYEP
jgi:hypothetical protein